VTTPDVALGLARTAAALDSGAPSAATLAARLPPWLVAATNQFAWERTLTGPDQIDLQFGVARDSALPDPGSAPWANGPWAPVLDAIGRWRRGELPFVPRLFVEVDNTPLGAPLRPLVFPGLSAPDPLGWGLAAMALLNLQSAGSCPAAISQGVLAVVRAVPAGGAGTYVAWMGARGTPHARWIGSVPIDALALFLAQVGWPGDADEVAQTVGTFVRGSSHVQLGFDVGLEGVGSRLGVELFWAHPIGGDPRMDHALGLLADWPEVDAARLDGAARWSRAQDLGHDLEPRLQLKLGWDQGRRAAKAYLGCWNL
jgi:hypothetical protein